MNSEMTKTSWQTWDTLMQQQEQKIERLQQENFELHKRLEWIQMIAKGMLPNELCDRERRPA